MIARRTYPAWLLSCICAAMCATTAEAQEGNAATSGTLTIVKRGITGESAFTYSGDELQAQAQQDLAAPLLLRLERGEGDPPVYTARFIGSVEGDYDLRTLITRRDGSPAEDLQPIMVRIVSNLPAGMETDLFDTVNLDVGVKGGYVRNLILFASLWLLIPLVMIVRRVMRSKPEEEVAVDAPSPTLADQLRPLIEAVANRELSIAEQGRLELLLYHYWQERLELGSLEVVDAVHHIREHPEAGTLLLAVEGWLHSPRHPEHETDHINELLEPYRAAAAIAEHKLAGAESAVPS